MSLGYVGELFGDYIFAVVSSGDISLLDAEGQRKSICWRGDCERSEQSSDTDLIGELHLECLWRRRCWRFDEIEG